MKKNKLLKLALIIGGLLFIWIVCSFTLYNKLKNIENNFKESAISYNYDSLNSLKDEPLVKIDEHDYYAKSCTKNAENEYFIEFENTYFGTVQINFPEPLLKDTTLEITIGELRNGNHVWTRQNAVANVHHSGQGVIYYKTDITVKKDSTNYTLIIPERTRPTSEQLPNDWQGGVLPFGYCEIKGYNGTLLAENFIQKAIYYPFNDDDSSFESNDDILNSVYKLCKDTVKATTYAGIFVDGYRELRPYEADAYVNTLSWYSVSADSQIVRNTLDTLLENHTWPSEWIYQTIFLAYEYYMQTGDTLYIQSIYPKLQDCLMEEQLNENGLIDINSNQESTLKNLGISQIRDIIDWPEVERDHFSTIKANNFSLKSAYAGLKNKYISFMAKIWGFNYTSELYLQLSNSYFSQGKEISSPNAVVNAYYFQSLKLLAFLSKEIGYTQGFEEYTQKANSFYIKYIDNFWDDNKKLIFDDVQKKHASLHSNMIALDFNLVPEVGKDSVANYVASKNMSCSVYASQILLESLYRGNKSDIAYKLITSTSDRSWYYMSNNIGSKLTTEAWNFNIKYDMDLNHAWGTAPLNIIRRYILGIQPEEAGYKIASFHPHLKELENCQATIPTTYGKISIIYEKTDSTFSYTINIPKGMQLHYYVDDSIKRNSLLIDGTSFDGKDYWLDEGAHSINAEYAD